MKDPIKLNMQYIASTYGLEPPVKLVLDLDTGILTMTELEPMEADILRDYEALRAIGERHA